MAPKKKKADAGPEDDSPEVLAAIEKQKMTVEVRAAAATTLSLASSRSLLKYLTRWVGLSQMDHLSLRMKMLLREQVRLLGPWALPTLCLSQELMTSQKSDMSKTIDKNNFKQEALYKSLNQQVVHSATRCCYFELTPCCTDK